MTGPLPAWHGYFDGNPEGFMFVMPGYALSGETTMAYDPAARRWNITHTQAGQTWRGTGSDTVSAFLDLIAARCDVRPTVLPRRGDSVEAFIKRARDQYVPTGHSYETGQWTALDNLLDDYRLHADTGADLTVDTGTLGPTAPGEQ